MTPMNDVQFIGEFEEFKNAWEFLEYESNIRYVWLISENSMRKLHSTFNSILNNSND